MSLGGELPQRGDDAVVRVEQPVVVGELILAVAREEPFGLRLIRGVFAKHDLQWPANARSPLFVGRCVPVEAHERVSSRIQDQLDGVDERAVEVEEEGRPHV